MNQMVGTLCARGYPDKLTHQDVVSGLYPLVDIRGGIEPVKAWDGSETSSTLTANNACGAQRMPDKDNFNCVVGGTGQVKSAVRRLTPRECERLMGFPDDWTKIPDWTDDKGKKHKVALSHRYKALGNSIVTGPNSFWLSLMEAISFEYEEPPTMGSLFDGIGGFPLAWEAVNGEGTAKWASEIEEFPIAVTKYHFPEE